MLENPRVDLRSVSGGPVVERRTPSRLVGVLLVLLCCVVCRPALSLAQDSEESARVYVREAVEAYEARDFQRAREAFESALAIERAPRVLRGLAMCEMELGRFAAAYRHLSEALARDGGVQALGPALRAHVEDELLPLVRSRVALWVVPEGVRVSVDGEVVSPDERQVLAVDSGPRRIEVEAEDGRRAEELMEVRRGDIGPLPVVVAALAPEPPPEPDERAEEPALTGSRVVVVPAPTVQIREQGSAPAWDPELSPQAVRVLPPPAELIPHQVRTRLSIWALGTLGAWEGAPATMVPAAGVGLTFALMTRFLPELAIGGQLEGTWTHLLDPCGPYAEGVTPIRTSQTCGWYRISLRLAGELHLDGVPLSLIVAIGPGVAFRGRQVLEAMDHFNQSVAASFFLAIDGGVRWYLVEEALFVGFDVRSAFGWHGDVGAALSAGGQFD